jgi:UDP-glucuronate 4-epimerase
MKILVTGAAGFIGSNLTGYLLKRNYQVVGIDNFNDYYSPKIKEYNLKDFTENPNFKLYRTDLLQKDALDEIFTSEEKFDAIIHLAAWAGVTNSFEVPDIYVRNNLEATVNLLELCKKGFCQNFIFASTSSIYGNNPTPFTEEMSTDFPLAPYPATKKACEVMIYTYAENFGINSTVFRIFNPNGPRMRPDLALPKLIKSCEFGIEFPQYWSDEDSEKTGRDYCFVEHMFEAMEAVINKPLKYEVFNLGNSSPVTLAELIKTVEKVTGRQVNIKKMPPRKGEMMVTYANIEKANRMIGYNPSTSIQKIVEIYYQWFLTQEDWYKKVTSVH